MQRQYKLQLLSYLLGPSFIFTFVCPVLEYQKITTFDQSNGELKYNELVEIPYLAFTIAQATLVILECLCCCCIFYHNCINCKCNKIYSFATVFLLIIPATYTALTISEISPIPFSCPRSYPYTSPKVKEACDIRAANLIFMWLNIFCLIIVITLICYPDKPDKSVRGNGNGVSIRRRSQSAKQAESNITASSFVARLFGDQYIPKSEVKKHRQEDSEIFIDSESEKFVDSQLQIV